MNEVKLHVANTEAFFDAAIEAAQRVDDGDLGQQESVIAFENMEVLLKALTANRWRLLRTLRAHGPTSIRKLSQSLDRDYRGVHTDVTGLLDLGLIHRRDRSTIEVKWNRIVAEMDTNIAA